MPPSRPSDNSGKNAGMISPAEAERMRKRMDRSIQKKQRESQGGSDQQTHKPKTNPPDPGTEPSKVTDVNNTETDLVPSPIGIDDAAAVAPTSSSGPKPPCHTTNNTQYNAPVQVNHQTTTTTNNHNYYETSSAHVQGNKSCPGGGPGRLLTKSAGFAAEVVCALVARVCRIVCRNLSPSSIAVLCVIFLGLWGFQAVSKALGRWTWLPPLSWGGGPSPPSPSLTVTVPPLGVSVGGGGSPPSSIPTEKSLIFPYARGVRQLLADVQRSSLNRDTSDIVVLYDQYAMLGAQIDSAWAEALSVLLTRMRSELGDMEHLPAAAVGEGTWWWWWCWSRIGLGTHPAISMGQRRVRRFVEIIITGQRIVQEAKRDLGSEYRPGQDQGQDGADGGGGGGPAVVMNKITQSLCTWADILDSEAEAGGEASSPEARVAAGQQQHYPTLGEEEAQRGAGNDAAAVCGILERNRDGRVKERIEVLDAFQSLLDEGLLGRWSLEEDLEAANGWFGADRDALASIERRMIEVYRACYAFVGKVFMRRG